MTIALDRVAPADARLRRGELGASNNASRGHNAITKYSIQVGSPGPTVRVDAHSQKWQGIIMVLCSVPENLTINCLKTLAKVTLHLKGIITPF